jgi:ATP-dependent Clp protease ATP-binding subunit ClpB
MQLEIEREGLRKETDAGSRERLRKIEDELSVLRVQADSLKAQWEDEKKAIARLREIREQMEQTKILIEQAERAYDLERAAELKYGRMVELDKELRQEEARLGELATKRAGFRLLKEEVDEEDIAEVVSRWTSIPVRKLLEGEIQKLLRLEQELHERVVGQDEAVAAVSEAVRRARAGLKDPSRPIGNFIFLGPTGVGKTELARALAECLFDDEKALVRIDMSEYMEKHSVARLIGAPPGYVGYEEGGQLTESVRRRPYSVILFDEIEKAHWDVFNVLLQILDEGRLTDSHGRTVDFKNTLIIMTSNIASHLILEHREGSDDESYQRMRETVLGELRRAFRPEFLNRVDEIVVFHALTEAHLKQIVDIQLRRLLQRLEDRQITLELTDRAKSLLAHIGYDPVYGARPLKRVIQRELETPLAKLILQGDVRDNSLVVADDADGQLKFSSQPKAVPVAG